ncbi:MAG: thioesterase [Deltaproteobacteria bacterium]|nr:thioesterase [Deltaproteobacteria bacterium]
MLAVGLKGEKTLVVSTEHLSSATGNIGAEVLSTHEVVLLMELAAREAIKGSLPPGKITVGTRVEIRHFAATPLGSRVRAFARLMDIRGRRLLFHVEAHDAYEKLADGENEQLIVSLDAFLNRVKIKEMNPTGE